MGDDVLMFERECNKVIEFLCGRSLKDFILISVFRFGINGVWVYFLSLVDLW